MEFNSHSRWLAMDLRHVRISIASAPVFLPPKQQYMQPTQSTADNQVGLIREAFASTPFLDLSWHFDPVVSFDDRRCQLLTLEPTVAAGTTFEEFVAQRRAERSPLAQLFVDAVEDGDDAASQLFHDMDLRADYIVGLSQDASVSAALLDYYGHFATFVERVCLPSSRRSGFPRTIAGFALDPVLKWSDDLEEPVAKELIERIESVIFVVAEHLASGRLDAELLELQNNLICCYWVIARALHHGLHAVVVSTHLLVFRRISAAAWSQIDERIRIQYSTLVLHLTLAFFPLGESFEAKSGFSNNTLADLRNLFRDAAGASGHAQFTVHQWVFSWFADKLDAEVFSWRALKPNDSSLSLLSDGEQSTVVELAQRFAGYRLPVTAQHLGEFLVQFGTTERIRGALRLLNHSKFFPLWELGETMELLLDAEIGNVESRLVVTPLGEQTGSTAIIRYLASHSKMAGRLVFADDIESALDQTKSGDKLCFIDDCLLSGTQTLNILGDLTGMRTRKQHHTKHGNALSAEYRAKLHARTLIFAYCVASDVGIERFHSRLVVDTGLNPGKVVLRYGVIEPSLAKAFGPLGPVAWASTQQREALKAFSQEVGYDILKRRAEEKGWTDARRLESALGFSDFQRLLIFPYNVPKTTLTMLWERGAESRNWMPLFRGYD
ncbi:hypothetical protein [Caballeronia sp. GAWG1-1]|uniref:phosphoribosyltransferase-like protein n=1 Tax=Caballeronia sp. GAWG1-1 TaxID=2921742 RepID=UPI002027B665|nr:hypothetical protein [Caballeronia sp. GAWG1-1]